MNPAILKEITDLLMAQERPGNPFPGRRGAPDMPSPRDEKRLAREPTDDNLQHFMDVFGEEALGNAGRKKSGPSPGYTPQPRPRYPDVESDIMGGYTPKSMDEIQQQGADFRPQDLDRMRRERSQYQDDVERETGTYPDDAERPTAPGMNDEEIQELIQRGLAPPRRR